VLTAQVAGVPAQDVAEEDGGFVVEVVPGRDDPVAVLECGRVEEVPFGEPARPARRATRGFRRLRDVVAVLEREVDLAQWAS